MDNPPENKHPPKKQPYSATRLGRILPLAPVKICIIYLVFGILWIIVSDQVFLSLPLPRDDIILISQVKGILFIIVTAILLFLLTGYFTRQEQEKSEELRVANDLLRCREDELKTRNAALARSQAEWEATYNSISDWICLIDPAGRIIRTNRGVESLLGIPPGQAIGRNCFDLVHGSACAITVCPRQRMLVSKKREISEVQMQHQPGWLQITVDPVFDREGNIISAVHMVREITERVQEQTALEQAKKKLHLLNYVTINEVQNAVFTLWGFQQFIRERIKDPAVQPALAKEDALISRISESLKFAQTFQNLGLKPPLWQDVNCVFLLAISHLDFLAMKHTIDLDGLEIFADPMLEQVLQILADNTLVHGRKTTRVTLRYVEIPQGLTLFYEDDGVGIPVPVKSEIFSSDFQKTKAIGLFLAREILEITGITIRETGVPGEGARFEILVPRGAYRLPVRK